MVRGHIFDTTASPSLDVSVSSDREEEEEEVDEDTSMVTLAHWLRTATHNETKQTRRRVFIMGEIKGSVAPGTQSSRKTSPSNDTNGTGAGKQSQKKKKPKISSPLEAVLKYQVVKR